MYHHNQRGRNSARRNSILRTVLVTTLAVSAGWSQPLHAADPLVSTAELHNQLRSAQQSRQAGLDRIQGFLRSDASRAVLETSKIDAGQIEKAVAFLSDEEVARLASQVQRIERDVAAGALSNEHLTYIVIALATAVVVLIAT